MDSGVKRIYVLVNGRALVPAKRMVLSPRTFRTWDAILRHLSSTLGINVQGLYDLQSGEQIAKHAGLAGLEDGWRYVAVAAGEKLKRNVEYLFPDGPVKPAANGDEILARKNSIGPHAPPVVRRLVPRAPASSGRFGPQSKGLRVFLFSNGDDSNQAISVVLNIRNCQSFSHLLETVTLSLRHPAYVRRLYNAETYLPITDLGELHDGISLVALAQGSLKIVHYRIPEASDGRRHEPDGAGDSQHTGTSVQICVFLPNGVPFHSGTRVTVSRGRFENLNKLLAHLAQHLKLSYGRPKRLYALPSGRRIHSIQELLDSACTHFSVATNNEPFIPCDYLNSRELKPPTAGADFANPRANSPSWFIEGETDRSRSAPGNMQRTNAAAAPGAATKTKAPKAPSKPVKSFMDTLEMSKRLLERQREMAVDSQEAGRDAVISVESAPTAEGILQTSRVPPIGEVEPSESQLDLFIATQSQSRPSKGSNARKRVSFGMDPAVIEPRAQTPERLVEANEEGAEDGDVDGVAASEAAEDSEVGGKVANDDDENEEEQT